MGFEPCGVLTLTTDFGHKGPYVATMKGVIYTRFPEARIIDLTHDSAVHWPAEAGFWLERSYKYFPRGTVHIAVVDPGVGTRRRILAAQHDGHVFVAPDNGLLAPLLDDDDPVHEVDLARLRSFGLSPPSATFHGRDIFAPLSADLASGRRTTTDLGYLTPIDGLTPSWIEPPEKHADGSVHGVVITFDHFGNVITNIGGHEIDHLESPVVHVAGQDAPFHRTYGEAKPGDLISLVNSFEMLEVARAEGSARDLLHVERGAPVRVTAS